MARMTVCLIVFTSLLRFSDATQECENGACAEEVQVSLLQSAYAIKAKVTEDVAMGAGMGGKGGNGMGSNGMGGKGAEDMGMGGKGTLQGSDHAEQTDTIGKRQQDAVNVMELLGEAGTGKVVFDNSDKVHHRSDATCLAAHLEMSLTSGNANMKYFGLSRYVPPAPSDYKVKKTYLVNSTVTGDVDRAVWFEKDGSCWLAFEGSTGQSDMASLYNHAPIEKWGMQLHGGLVAELEPLLKKMDFDQMRSVCTGSLTLIGHSMGGGMAQIAAMALNKQGDPLGANLTVDRLYTFAAQAVTATEQGNDKSADGCFEGESYWYVQPAASGGLLVDTAQNGDYGAGHTYNITKTSKHYVFGNGSMIDFPCGTPLAPGTALFHAVPFMDAMIAHMKYLGYLGCI